MRRTLLILSLAATLPLGGCGSDPTGGADAGDGGGTNSDMGNTDMSANVGDGGNRDMPASNSDMPASNGDMPAGVVDMTGGPTDAPIFVAPDAVFRDGGIPIHDGGALCYQATCQGKLYECGDCADNDGDNLIDAEDPNCLGACQNNEAGFSGNIPGQNNAPCKMDCYFDQDTGSGNDDCQWDHHCDTHEMMMSMDPETGCNYDPNTKFPGGGVCADRYKMQSMACLKFCGPLTPNGCDCFGCCAIPPNNSMTDGVYLGSVDANGVPTCDLKSAADPKRCRPCQIVQGCFNPCGHCELCIGKTKLPDDCFPKNDAGMTIIPDSGIMGQCPNGEQPCGLQGQLPCPQGFFCVTGCCQQIIG